jgi:hypothetical protein
MRFLRNASTTYDFDKRMAFSPRVPAELAAFLDVRLKIAERARARNSSSMGRVYNALSGENPDYLRLTGSELEDVLKAIGAEVGDIVDRSAWFELRVDVAAEVFETF